MIIASKILSDIEELHKLKQQGTISQDEYKSTISQMLEALLKDGNVSLYCLEPAEKLVKSGALTKAEFEALKNKVLANTVSSTQDSDKKISKKMPTNNKSFSILHLLLCFFVIIAHGILFILRIPLVILNVVLGWKIQEDIIAEGVKKGIKK